MAEQKLLVKREGDFHYPIFLKMTFRILPVRSEKKDLKTGKSVL